MKVILIKQVPKVGKIGDILNVKDGYGKNFLIARGLAIAADASSLKALNKKKSELAMRQEEDLLKNQEMAQQLDGRDIVVGVKAGNDGEIFGSVSAFKIAEAIKRDGFAVEKNHITLDHPLKSLGEYKIPVKFGHNIEAEINLIIEAE